MKSNSAKALGSRITPLFIATVRMPLSATQQKNMTIPATLSGAAILGVFVVLISSKPLHAETLVDDAALSELSSGENSLAYGRTYHERPIRIDPTLHPSPGDFGLIVKYTIA